MPKTFSTSPTANFLNRAFTSYVLSLSVFAIGCGRVDLTDASENVAPVVQATMSADEFCRAWAKKTQPADEVESQAEAAPSPAAEPTPNAPVPSSEPATSAKRPAPAKEGKNPGSPKRPRKSELVKIF